MSEQIDLHEYKDVLVSGVDYDFSANRHQDIPRRLYLDWSALIIKLAQAVYPTFVPPPFPPDFFFKTESIPSDGPYSSDPDYYMLDYVSAEIKGENGHGLMISFEHGRMGGGEPVRIETLGFRPGVSAHIAKEATSPRATIYVWHEENRTDRIREIIYRHHSACLPPRYSDKVGDCYICGDFPDEWSANTGRDEYFPSPVSKLVSVPLGGSAWDELRRCPQCGTFFKWVDSPQMYGSGNNAEEELSRLPEQAGRLLDILLSDGPKDAAALGNLDDYFRFIKAEILLEILGFYLDSVPQTFRLFIPNLWRLLIRRHHSGIKDLLIRYIADDPTRADEVLEALKSVQAGGEQSPVSETIFYCLKVLQQY